jgi:O-antigen ligase
MSRAEPAQGIFTAELHGRRVLLVGVAALLLLATLGEGGGSSESLLRWHGGLVALVLWSLLAPRSPSDPVHVPAQGPLAAGTLFLALTAAGAALAPYAYAAWLTCLELAACLAVFLLGARIGPGLVSLLRWPLGLGAVLQVALILWQRGLAGETRPAGTFLNTNHMAAWMVAVLLMLVGGWRGVRSRAGRIVAAGMALAAAAGVLLSGSRGALAGLGVAAIWLVTRWWKELPRPARTAVVAGFIVLGALAGWRQVGRLGEADPFRYQRVRIWKASAGVFMEDPWWGSGPGQFAVAAKRFQFADDDGPLQYDRRFAIPHSDLLRVPAEFGAPAAIVLFTAVGLAVLELRRRRREGALRVAHDGAIAALLALAVQGLVDDPSRWPAVYLLACAVLGSLLARSGETVPARRRPATRIVFALLLVLVFLVGDAAPTLAHLAFSSLPPDPAPETGRRLELALRLNPAHPLHHLRKAEYATGRRFDGGLAAYAVARESAERALRLQPADATYAWGVARVESRACVHLFRDRATRERAAQQYERAQMLAPTDPRISIEAGEFMLDAADPLRARRLAERALRIEPNGVPSRLLLAAALIESGEPGAKPRAAELLREARELALRWSGTAEQGVYQAELLTLDPRSAARVEALLGADE